jgi:phosphoglycerol transferase MdoB-like AlkP superfamily enzyme
VYYSQNQFLNHSAVNPVFNFLDSMDQTASTIPNYQFMEEEERARLMEGIYPTESVDTDTLLNTARPNVIVILLESCGGIFTEDIGGRKDIMPNLNRYVHEGVYFSQFYANSYRTDRGTLCTWSGYPSFPTSSVMKIPSKTRFLPGLARSLREEGYQTSYLYGGDINFTNMRSYLVSGGFSDLTWKDDYTKEEQTSAKWGVRDDITFQTLTELTQTMRQPFLIGYSTLSSHVPWDVPIHHFDDEVLNAFYYLDQCVGNFIQQLRQSDLWNNTLVIMLPDHGIVYAGLDESNPLLNHIPMLWVGGVIKQPRRIEQVCNQTDLPATLLGQLGIAHDDYTFSRDVLSVTYKNPFAIHTYDDGYTIIDSASFVNYDFISNRVVSNYGKDRDKLILRAKAILQAASKDLNKR